MLRRAPRTLVRHGTLPLLLATSLLISAQEEPGAGSRCPPPAPVPEFDQAQVDLAPKRIPEGPAAELTLREALETISRETGSRVRFYAPQPEKHLESKRTIDLGGRTFWEAYDAVRAAWEVYISGLGGELTVNHRTPEPNTWNPFGAGRLEQPYGARMLHEAVNHGAFKIALERNGDSLRLSLYPEPRLHGFQTVRSTVRVRFASGKPVRLEDDAPPEDGWLHFDFRLPSGAGEIVAVETESALVYAHDWRLVDLGPIADLREKSRKVKAGKASFAVRSAVVAKAGDGEVGIEVSFEFDSDVLVHLDELYLVSADGAEAWRGPRWEYALRGPRNCSFGTMPEDRFAGLELHVRAPHAVKQTKVKYTLDLRDHP